MITKDKVEARMKMCNGIVKVRHIRSKNVSMIAINPKHKRTRAYYETGGKVQLMSLDALRRYWSKMSNLEFVN